MVIRLRSRASDADHCAATKAGQEMMRRLGWVLVSLYAVACVLSLLVIYFSVNHLFGIEPDPLSGIFALILALPWTVVLSLFANPSPLASAIVLAVGMGINLALAIAMLRRKRA
jgi:hypothetical protein